MLILTKPAIEYSSEERESIYFDLIKKNRKKYSIEGKLTGAQESSAKANAWKAMKKAGF